MSFPRYWDWAELQRFLVDNDLVIATGLGEDDEMSMTGKGVELLDVLAMARHLDGAPPTGGDE